MDEMSARGAFEYAINRELLKLYSGFFVFWFLLEFEQVTRGVIPIPFQSLNDVVSSFLTFLSAIVLIITFVAIIYKVGTDCRGDDNGEF